MKKFCLAYGRNLDLKRMKKRCPNCSLVGKALLRDWRIAFYKYITIERKKGYAVPVGVWEIDEKGEQELDIIEHFPTLYRKEMIDFEFNGKKEKVLVYLINDDHPKYPDKPYYEDLLIGYKDFGFDEQFLTEAIKRLPKKKVFIVSTTKPDEYITALNCVDIKSSYGMQITEKELQCYDGIVIAGGEHDVSPKWYGQANSFCNMIDEKADRQAFKIIDMAIKYNKPILGICLGLQYINVYFKGSLKQDVKGHRDVFHKFYVVDNSMMKSCFGKKFIASALPRKYFDHLKVLDNTLFKCYLGPTFTANSLHHQCIDRLGEELDVVAVSQDKTIESIVNKEKNILAVQWHPELLLESNGLKIFEIFKSVL